MKKFLKSKKALLAAALAAILAMSGVTYAWFTWSVGVTGGDVKMDYVQIEADMGVWIEPLKLFKSAYQSDVAGEWSQYLDDNGIADTQMFIPFAVLQGDKAAYDKWIVEDGAFLTTLYLGGENPFGAYAGWDVTSAFLGDSYTKICKQQLPGNTAKVGLKIENLGAAAWVDLSGVFDGVEFEPDSNTSFAVGYGGNFLNTGVAEVAGTTINSAGWQGDDEYAYAAGSFNQYGEYNGGIDGNGWEFVWAQHNYNWITEWLSTTYGTTSGARLSTTDLSVPLKDVNAVYLGYAAPELVSGIDTMRSIGYSFNYFNPVQLWGFKDTSGEIDTGLVIQDMSTNPNNWQITFGYEGDVAAAAGFSPIDLTDLAAIEAYLADALAGTTPHYIDPQDIINALVDLMMNGTDVTNALNDANDYAYAYVAYVPAVPTGATEDEDIIHIAQIGDKTFLYMSDEFRNASVSVKFDVNYGKYLDNRFTNSMLLFAESASVVAVQAGGDAGNTAAEDVFGVVNFNSGITCPVPESSIKYN